MHEQNSADAVRTRGVVAIVKTRFGTDGIRGRVPQELCAEQAFRVGAAVAEQLREKKGGSCRIVLAHDPRASSDMLEAAVTAGLCAAGAEVERISMLPTPAVARTPVFSKTSFMRKLANRRGVWPARAR